MLGRRSKDGRLEIRAKIILADILKAAENREDREGEAAEEVSDELYVCFSGDFFSAGAKDSLPRSI